MPTGTASGAALGASSITFTGLAAKRIKRPPSTSSTTRAAAPAALPATARKRLAAVVPGSLRRPAPMLGTSAAVAKVKTCTSDVAAASLLVVSTKTLRPSADKAMARASAASNTVCMARRAGSRKNTRLALFGSTTATWPLAALTAPTTPCTSVSTKAPKAACPTKCASDNTGSTSTSKSYDSKMRLGAQRVSSQPHSSYSTGTWSVGHSRQRRHSCKVWANVSRDRARTCGRLAMSTISSAGSKISCPQQSSAEPLCTTT